MDMGPFYITQPNRTKPMMLSQGPNPTHPPLHDPCKGDIFQLNVANSKMQNRSRSYVGYNMTYGAYKQLQNSPISQSHQPCTKFPTDHFYGLELRSSQPRLYISDSTSHCRKVSLSVQPNPWMDPTFISGSNSSWACRCECLVATTEPGT